MSWNTSFRGDDFDKLSFGSEPFYPKLITKADVELRDVDNNNKFKRRFKMDGFWKMMVYDTYRDTFDDVWSFLGTVFLTFILAGLAWLVFFIIDTAYVEPYETQGTTISSNFSPAHMMPVTTTVGKSTITTMVYVDDSWSIRVFLDEVRGSVSCGVSQSEYNQFVKGTDVFIDAITGRLSGDSYCDGYIGTGG